ncbi:MAG: serine/threonine protein kinase [Planctomycetaceae bacterium]|nr:serine/threonine protein kinase [Planctomycetaceae bacterium]
MAFVPVWSHGSVPMSTPTPFSAQPDETIIVAQPLADVSRTGPPRGNVELVAGSGPRLESETQSLLRVRLRAAALVLVAGVVTFFVRDLFVADAPVFVFRAVIVAVIAGIFALLASRVALSLAQLRWIELGLFSLTSVYLAVYQYSLVLLKAKVGNPAFELAAIKSSVLYFFAVVLLYGTFIPNTWQRAAKILVPISLAPFVVMGLLRFRSTAGSELAQEIATFEQMSDHVIMMVLGLVSAVYGTHIINTLRVAAFKARKMGQYHLKERIGVGGMGEVYLAEHCLLKRPCAIKLIRPDSQSDPLALARFEREVRTTAKLTHWNTIDIYDYGRTDDGTFYYVMEFLPGMSLGDLVKRHGPLAPARLIHLLRQTCHALREAHAAGLIHRDIKPANIFVSRLGGICDVAKLLDFGLVKHTADDENAQLPQEGSVSGTPLFMSPEQAVASKAPDARCDIYSLGATAYHALTGQPPFEGSNPIQVMIAHARDPVTPPSKIRPGIPGDLEQVVLTCLAKRPDDRYPDVSALERALGACTDAEGWSDALGAC